MKIAWDLNAESLRSIQREHDMYMQRVWGLCERAWDVNEEIIRST